ncbi:biopolymer transporter ExbD [bacterium]|nr:biopolymer transporter ExbD [bacterium]
MEKTILKTMKKRSILESQSKFNENANPEKKVIYKGILLTSLVDVFSILVIYLLVNSGAQQHNIMLKKGITPPSSVSTDAIKNGLNIYVKNNKYYINDKLVRKNRLKRAIKYSLKKSKQQNLVLISDKKTDFKYLNPILIFSEELNIKNISFGLISKGKG